MDREERRQKRKKDTQSAVITMVVLMLVVVVFVVGVVLVLHKFVKPKMTKPDTEKIETVETETPEETGTGEVTDPMYEQAMQIATGLTLEQRVAQMFMITPDALTGVSGATRAGDSTRSAFAQYPVGGLVYMSANLTGPDQTTEMLSNMKNFSQDTVGLPIFLGVDEEGGTVTRIASNQEFGVTDVGNMSAVGASGDAQNAYNAGSTIGTYLNNLGFNMDFAPVADVLSNPDNAVVKDRSFGSDSQLVADMVCAEMNGLNEHQIAPVIKHFPGHGATSGDSHDGVVTIEKSLDELMANELIPFQQAINSGASFVMVGHISVPAITGDNTPASLSNTMVTGVLRNQMGFHGVVITDAMDMGAITASYSSADAAVAAINAGVDIILMPDDFKSAYQGVLDAVANGTISEERINESAARIIKAKLMIN